MDEKVIRLKASFKGIISSLLFLLLKFIITFSFFTFINRVKNGIFNRNDIGFRSSFANPMDSTTSLPDLAILYLIYIGITISLIFLGILLYRVITLLMKVSNKAIFDYNNEKIITAKRTSPFTKLTEENIFYKIIEASVSQNHIERLFNTGKLYIAYLVLGETDSHIRYVEMDYIEAPFKAKKKLI
ncbi:hypothetical protein Amet_2167 [Alkaliphilus metalliredigens QYMF]|uniref:DUF304 domain-containing protein n=1 Tax=Alkaliphilus metalliredigens (strain QYMF) TaxID=293826 RepID=A6TQ58_ALKMQ|nr:hypothetical protein [Alkaliphilus metalliredigens]ABR48326.1 hypothetical protein Amet_2167 [Alkaliphilus metalliredigens QYMF]